MAREAKHTALIVDDDAAFTSDLQSSLVRAGYNVLAAGTATQAQKIWHPKAHTQIDVAIVDLNLPDMSGIELIRQISVVSGVPTKILATTESMSALHLEIAGYVGAHAAVRKFAFAGQGFPSQAWVDAVDTLLAPEARAEPGAELSTHESRSVSRRARAESRTRHSRDGSKAGEST